MERAIRKIGMDLSQIYSKTSKGILEGNSRSLTREHGRVLSLVDGKTTVGEILEKSKRLSQNRLAAVLDELAAAGLVRAANAGTNAPQDDLGFSSTIIVDESNTQAFFEAQAELERELARRKATEAEATESDRASLLADVKADIEAEAAAIRREEEQRKAAAAERARQEAQRKEAEAKARAEAEERARQEKAKQEKERKAAEAAELARKEAQRKEAEAKARAEADAKVKAAEAARLKAEQEARVREAEALARAKAEQQAREEAERKAKAEAEARRAAEQKAKQAEAEAQARAKAEAEAAARREAEAKAQAEQEAKARAEMQAKLTALEEAQRRAEEQADVMARQLEEARIAAELEARAKRRLEARAKEEAEARERAEAEARAKLEQEARLRAEAEAKAQQEAEARRKAEQEAESRLEAERQARAEAERKAQEEAQAKARAEEERRKAEQLAAEQAEQARREAEAAAQAKLESERRAREEAEVRAKAEAEARERAEAEARAKREQEEAERAETERRTREAAEARAREEEAVREAELAVKLESERVARELAEAEAREAREREEARRLAKEQAEAQVRAEAEEAQRRVEAELRREQEEEQRLREEAEARAKAAAELAKGLVLPRRRFDPKWFKYAGGGLGLTLVAAVGLAHVLSFNFFLPTLEAQLERSLGHRAAVQDLHFSAFPLPHWRMEGVVIGNAQEVRAQRIELTPTLGSWFSEAKQVSRIELESVTLTPQSLDLLARWRNAQSGSPVFTFGTIHVRNAKLAIPDLELFPFDAEIEQAKGKFGKVHIASTDRRVTIDLQPQGENTLVKINATRSVLPFAPQMEFERFKLTGVAQAGLLAASEIEGELYGGSFTGSGNLSWGKQWQLNAEWAAKQISLEPALKALSREIRITGLLEAKARLAATSEKFGDLLASPQAQATFRAKEGEISNLDLVGALHAGNRAGITGGKTHFNELSGYLKLADGRYDYQQIKMNLGVVSATGNVILNEDRSLGGNLLAELRSRATTMRVPLVLKGHAGAPTLKAAGGASPAAIRRAVEATDAPPAEAAPAN